MSIGNPNPEQGSGYYFLGQDIMTIPCIRKCFISGFGASIGTTLFSFLFTSNGWRSTNHGVLAFMLVTFPYIFYCNHEFNQQSLKLLEVQEAIRRQTGNDYIVLDSIKERIQENPEK